MGDQRRLGLCGTSFLWSSGCTIVASAQWLACDAHLPVVRRERSLLLPLACAIESASRARCGAAAVSILVQEIVTIRGRGGVGGRYRRGPLHLVLGRWMRSLLLPLACAIESASRARCGAAAVSILVQEIVTIRGRGGVGGRYRRGPLHLVLGRWMRSLLLPLACAIESASRARCGAAAVSILVQEIVTIG